jgi:hypothetical protein
LRRNEPEKGRRKPAFLFGKTTMPTFRQYHEAIDALTGLYLEDSFVFDIVEGQDSLYVVITDAHVTEADDWRRPKGDKHSDYQEAIIAFEGVTELVWKKKSFILTPEPGGKADIGCIDYFHLLDDGRYLMGGDWGEFTCRAVYVRVYRDTESIRRRTWLLSRPVLVKWRLARARVKYWILRRLGLHR